MGGDGQEIKQISKSIYMADDNKCYREKGSEKWDKGFQEGRDYKF